MFNYDVHNFSYDIEICNCAIPVWRLNMLFGSCVMTSCFHIWLLCFCNVLICHSTLAFGYYTLQFCHCILVFFNFDIGTSSFAVVICHFHGVRFIIAFCQGNMQFSMTLRNEFRAREIISAKIIIMLICFLSVALSWLETWRLFVKDKRLNTGMAPTCDWMSKIVKVN